jgi:hypothetical protein
MNLVGGAASVGKGELVSVGAGDEVINVNNV